MRTTLWIVFLLAEVLAGQLSAWAEGSKQLTPNNNPTVPMTDPANTRSGWLEHDANFPGSTTTGLTSNGFLKPSTYNHNGVVFSEDHRMYVRVKAGELLYYGVHRVFNGNATANQRDLFLELKYGTGAGTSLQKTRLYRDSTATGSPIYQSLLSTTNKTGSAQAGVIQTAAQALAGPLSGSNGGYAPLIYQNTSGADQDVYVEFTQYAEEGATTTGGTVIAALGDQQRCSTYDFWDFTVKNSSGTEKPGRLYSKQWAFSGGAYSPNTANPNRFSATFAMYPLLPSTNPAQVGRYFVKKFDLSGINPQNYFRFVVNSRGTTASTTDFSVSRRSQTTAQDYPEYATFVNNPDLAIWPNAIDPTFAVNTITSFCSGGSGGLAFTTTASEAGQLIITLDLDGVTGYQAGGRDVFIEKTVAVGKSTVGWNGLDGQGAVVASNTPMTINFKSSVGAVNFPVVDVENNANGFTISSVRPSTTFNYLFWDDTNLDATKFPASNTRVEASGQNTGTGVHIWGSTTPLTASSVTDAGNLYTVNTYSYVTINNASQVYTYTYTCDKDADGMADNSDIDKDNDGITDSNESNGVNPTALTSLGAPTYLDAAYVDPTYGAFRDTNSDGINDIFDLDLDGIPNFLDIDSDNDGIPDTIEANGGVALTGYNASLSRFPATNVGANGMPDAAETTPDSGIASFTPTNTSASGHPDFLDIDADNDGIVDNIEAQLTAAYRAPSGTDTDGDGLDDQYDLTPGGAVAAGTAVPLTNTDGTDLADYRDTNVDNDSRLDAVEGWDTDGDGVANTLASGIDADGDGLDDAYDKTVSTASFSPTNGGQTPQSFPDVQVPGGDHDWRQRNIPPTANNIVAPAMPSSNGATAIPALSGSDPDGPAGGANLTYTLVTVPTTTQGVLSYLNGTTAGTGTRVTAGTGATVPLANINSLQFDPDAAYNGNVVFTYKVTESFATGGQDSPNATYIIPIGATASIAGIVYEDINYGGGSGRTRGTASTSATSSGLVSGTINRSGATVELYDASGNFLATTATTSTGSYTFTNLIYGTYKIRVVNSTVTSVRNTNAVGLLGVQTYNSSNGAGQRVGGEVPSLIDAAAHSPNQLLSDLTTPAATPQSITTITSNGTAPANGIDAPTNVTGVNFGFNFDTVVNTNDSGQGSLRQFIINANALPNTTLNQVALNGTAATGTTSADPAAGVETAIFMMSDGRAAGVSGLRGGMTATSGYNASTTQFTITLNSALPIVTDANTAIDGYLQTVITGGKITPVGESTTGPKVVINFNNQKGLFVTAGTTHIASIGLNNALGNVATTASDGAGVTFSGASVTGSSVTDVTATGNASAGILLQRSGSTDATNATDVTITNSILNGGITAGASDADGLSLAGASGNTITGNTLNDNKGWGILLATGNNTGNTFTSNIIRRNGSGANAEDAGIGIQLGTSNTFTTNIITASAGDGIMAYSGTSSNTFTQNSISGNGELGIDLLANSTSPTGTGNGPTLNADSKTSASGANSMLNFPVITQAKINNNNLQITGYAPAGAVVEVFVAAADGTGFGEGQTYLASRTEGLAADDAATGTGFYTNYSNPAGGPVQGSGTNANMFSFTMPLTTAQQTALMQSGAAVTATATVSSATSEFSGVAPTSVGPLPVALVAFTAQVGGHNHEVQLVWRTASEQYNDHFEMERSFTGTSFTRIATVAGQGTTAQTTAYTLTDTSIGAQVSGLVYYRLKQVDTDGTATYSPVQAVTLANAPTTPLLINLYPNPTSDHTSLDLSQLPATTTVQLQLLDATGRLALTRTVAGGQSQLLDVHTLPSGLYLLRVSGTQPDGSPLRQTLRLTKE